MIDDAAAAGTWVAARAGSVLIAVSGAAAAAGGAWAWWLLHRRSQARVPGSLRLARPAPATGPTRVASAALAAAADEDARGQDSAGPAGPLLQALLALAALAAVAAIAWLGHAGGPVTPVAPAAAPALAHSGLAAFDVALAEAMSWRWHAAAADGVADGAADGAAASTQMPALRPLLALLSHLGDRWTLSALTIAMLVLAVRRRDRLAAALWMLGMGGQALLVQGLKQAVERARPLHLPDAWVVVQGHSFPSGHTAAITVAAWLLCWQLLRDARPDEHGPLQTLSPSRRHLRSLACGAVLATAVAVGLTRALLHVHWASDVLAGWVVGSLWVAGVIAAGGWFRRPPWAWCAPAAPAGPGPTTVPETALPMPPTDRQAPAPRARRRSRQRRLLAR